MTWSHGYFCPVCECRWAYHLCKDGKLPCGCGVKVDDAVYIYTKRYAKSGFEVQIQYKGFKIDEFFPKNVDYEEIEKRLCEKVAGHPQADLLKKAIHNAIWGKSLYWKDWIVRCSKCKYFTSPYNKKKCRIHNWCSIDCSDFCKSI